MKARLITATFQGDNCAQNICDSQDTGPFTIHERMGTHCCRILAIATGSVQQRKKEVVIQGNSQKQNAKALEQLTSDFPPGKY